MSTYINSKEFAVRFDTKLITCEQGSSMSISSEPIRVRCKTSGKYGTLLANPDLSGQVSFSGAYINDPTASEISAFNIMNLVGTFGEVIYGGTLAGQQIFTFDAMLLDAVITSDDGTEVTFEGTLDVTGADPVLGAIPT